MERSIPDSGIDAVVSIRLGITRHNLVQLGAIWGRGTLSRPFVCYCFVVLNQERLRSLLKDHVCSDLRLPHQL